MSTPTPQQNATPPKPPKAPRSDKGDKKGKVKRDANIIAIGGDTVSTVVASVIPAQTYETTSAYTRETLKKPDMRYFKKHLRLFLNLPGCAEGNYKLIKVANCVIPNVPRGEKYGVNYAILGIPVDWMNVIRGALSPGEQIDFDSTAGPVGTKYFWTNVDDLQNKIIILSGDDECVINLRSTLDAGAANGEGLVVTAYLTMNLSASFDIHSYTGAVPPKQWKFGVNVVKATIQGYTTEVPKSSPFSQVPEIPQVHRSEVPSPEVLARFMGYMNLSN